jgi:hypothetical protein
MPTALYVWEWWRSGLSNANTKGLGGDGSAPKIGVNLTLWRTVHTDLLIAPTTLMYIYNLMLDPPCSLSPPLPLPCLPHLPRDVIRPLRQSQPRSGGVEPHDFHVPNAEGL